MFQPLYEATRRVPNPNKTEIAAGRLTVYDTWLNSSPSDIDGRPVYATVFVYQHKFSNSILLRLL